MARKPKPREKVVATGIFARRSVRMRGDNPSMAIVREFVRRQNEDVMASLAPLESHAVSVVRRHGSAVVERAHGYTVVRADPAFLAKMSLPAGARLHPPIPATTGKPRPRDPEYQDACDILANMCGIRLAMERGDLQQVAKDAFRLGMAAVRLGVRPYEDDARVGREYSRNQRAAAIARHGDTAVRNAQRVAEFERAMRTTGTTEVALRTAAAKCACGRTAVREALKAAGKLPRRKAK